MDGRVWLTISAEAEAEMKSLTSSVSFEMSEQHPVNSDVSE